MLSKIFKNNQKCIKLAQYQRWWNVIITKNYPYNYTLKIRITALAQYEKSLLKTIFKKEKWVLKTLYLLQKKKETVKYRCIYICIFRLIIYQIHSMLTTNISCLGVYLGKLREHLLSQINYWMVNTIIANDIILPPTRVRTNIDANLVNIELIINSQSARKMEKILKNENLRFGICKSE